MNDEFKKALDKARAGTPVKKRKSVKNPVRAHTIKVTAEEVEGLKKRQEITKRLLHLRTLILDNEPNMTPITLRRDINSFDKVVTAFTDRKISKGLTTKEREKLNLIFIRYRTNSQ